MLPNVRRVAAGVLVMAASAAGAQQAPQEPVKGLESFSAPSATPTPDGAIPVPPAPVITLPRPRAAATPRPRATPRPEATPTSAPRPGPTPDSDRAPMADATPAAEPTPAPKPSPTPEVSASPAPQPTQAPVGPSTPDATPVQSESSGPPWLQMLAALAVAGIAGWLLLGRRRRVARITTQPAAAEPAPPPEPTPPVAAPEPIAPAALRPVPVVPPPPAPQPVDPARPRAWLGTIFRPTRAGLNLLSATVEGEISVTNTGDASAQAIRVDARLLSAHAGQDVELAALYAQRPGRSAVPPFTLAPGETRTARIVVASPRDAIRPMTAAGRPMFVPIVALSIRYDAGNGDEGQTAQAFAVGVERADSAKLAPFWLDGSPRTHDAVAARPHAAVLER